MPDQFWWSSLKTMFTVIVLLTTFFPSVSLGKYYHSEDDFICSLYCSFFSFCKHIYKAIAIDLSSFMNSKPYVFHTVPSDRSSHRNFASLYKTTSFSSPPFFFTLPSPSTLFLSFIPASPTSPLAPQTNSARSYNRENPLDPRAMHRLDSLLNGPAILPLINHQLLLKITHEVQVT